MHKRIIAQPVKLIFKALDIVLKRVISSDYCLVKIVALAVNIIRIRDINIAAVLLSKFN